MDQTQSLTDQPAGAAVSPIGHDKNYWRQHGRTLRRQIPAEKRAAASAEIQRRLLAWPRLKEARVVAPYASISAEVSTFGLIEALLEQGKVVALPRVIHWRKALELRQIEGFPDSCEKSEFGILEPIPAACPRVIAPSEVDLFIVPGVVFDRGLYRIGYGGGFFDKLLAEGPGRKTVGLAYQAQVVDSFPHDRWDQPVDIICTEEGFLSPE